MTPSAVTPAATVVNVNLPAGVDVTNVGVVASGTLRLRDRASIQLPSGRKERLFNLGGTTTTLGVNVAAGDLVSKSSVFMANYSRISGNLVTGGTLTRQAGATVTGTISQRASVAAPDVLSWEQPLQPDLGNPQTVFADAQLALAPGSYGKLTVYSRGKVTFSPGAYAFSELQLEPDAVLALTSAAQSQPTMLYVDKVSAFRGRVVSDAAPAAETLLFVYSGTSPLRLERGVEMAIVAPNATVELAASGSSFIGSVYAKGIDLSPDVTLVQVPYQYWGWVLPVQPFVSCVMGAGPGRYMAAFGYENGNSYALQRLAGAGNQFLPQSSLFPVPESFLPGRHEESVWVDMTSAGVTWQVSGLSATATLSSPPCKLPPPSEDPVWHAEARGLPSPSLPHAPSPDPGVSDRNMIGPGRFVTPLVPSGLPVFGLGGPTGGVPQDPSVPPDIPPGLTLYNQPTDLLVDVNAAVDGLSERVFLDIESYIGGENQGEELVVEEPEICVSVPCAFTTGSYQRSYQGPDTDRTQVAFYAQEHNEFSSTEATLVSVTLHRDTLTWSGLAQSGPASSDDYGNFASVAHAVPIAGVAGQPFTYVDYAGNNYRFTISVPQLPLPQQETRLCFDWTAYFVDTAVPGAPLEEGYPGESFAAAFAPNPTPDEYARLRSHDAAFAVADLRIRSAYASFNAGVELDVDGCTSLPSLLFVYADAAEPGSADGGIALWAKLFASNVVPARSGFGTTVFPVRDWASTANSTIGLNAFDNGPQAFQLVNGLRLPPAKLDLAGQRWNHLTTVAAAVGRLLQVMDEDGIELPSQPENVYPVVVGDGVLVGTFDYQCQEVPDSAVSGRTLKIGPGFFPCEDEVPGRCDNPAPPGDCRKSCQDDAECPGAQHCANSGDVEQACDGSQPCFCAYAGQGSMKYVVAHEFGHVVQGALLGLNPSGSYDFSCPKGQACEALGRTYTSPGSTVPVLIDPPGMAAECGCEHVTAANALHCLQSVERGSAAQSEGFGQFWAARAWNKKGGPCLFTYYKEFLDDVCHGAACRPFSTRDGRQLQLTELPVPLDCGADANGLGPRWRNTHNCAIPTGSADDVQLSEMGTEFDWLTFYRAVSGAGLPLGDLMAAFRHGCQPENGPLDASGGIKPVCGPGQAPADGCYSPGLLCNGTSGYLGKPTMEGEQGRVVGREVYWLDRVATYDPVTNPEWSGAPVYDRGGLLDGARRAWGPLDPRTTRMTTAGFENGVDENVAP